MKHLISVSIKPAAAQLDKILKGWKPDLFVKGPMSGFVDAP
jgi:hypothetical protein